VPSVECGGDPLGADAAACRAGLAGFRRELYRSFTRRRDALFELCEAVLCASGPVMVLPELSLEAVHRRGHGSTYAALSAGRIEVGGLRRSLVGLPLPRTRGGQIRLAVDVTPWPRPDAPCSPQRAHCHRGCGCGGTRKTVPGWPYSMVVALESGPTSWTMPLDAQRLRPGQDLTEGTAEQIRDVLDRLAAAGQHAPGDPPVLVVLDAGYDVVRLAWLLRDAPVHLVARLRSDRVFYAPPQPARGRTGRPGRHGPAMTLADAATWPARHASHTSERTRYGRVTIQAWDRMHQKLTRRGGWQHHPGPLPVIDGALILARVDRLPGDRHPKPVWLWHSHPTTADLDLGRIFAAYCRRFDAEHTFRFIKQVLGWTRPRVRTPEQADRWTWLIIAAYTQLRLARGLTDDLRRPWHPPLTPNRLTPGRVRRGFPRIRATIGVPATAPKPTRPGPGRPKGSRNRQPAHRHPVGKPPEPSPSHPNTATTRR
jgi:DDE superfamily endonuclease